MKKEISNPITTVKILLVDDSAFVRASFRQQLSNDFDIVEASSGHQAIKWLEVNYANIIISDINMQDGNGLELLAWLREQPNHSTTPFILITGSDINNKQKQQAIDKGASDFITKNIDRTELISRIRSHLEDANPDLDIKGPPQHLDQRTGRLNRAGLLMRASAYFAISKRRGYPMCIVTIHIDKLNELITQIGMNRTNSVYQRIAEILSRRSRTEDCIATTGRGQYSILLPTTSASECMKWIERIRKCIEREIIVHHGGFATLTISAGVSHTENSHYSSEEEMLDASIRLSQFAEITGGNQIKIDTSPEMATLTSNHQLESILYQLQNLNLTNRAQQHMVVETVLPWLLPYIESYLKRHTLSTESPLNEIIDLLKNHSPA